MAAQFAQFAAMAGDGANDVIIHIGDTDDTVDDTADGAYLPTMQRHNGLAAARGASLNGPPSAWSTASSSSSSLLSQTPTLPTTASARIPRTTAARLARSTPAVTPDAPVPAATYVAHTSEKAALAGRAEPDTVLYLAYGSNMAAATFEGVRKIKPVSCITVSAPTLRLTFDLPGIPYREPCAANTAVRKVPKVPPKVPDVPDVPDLPLPAPPGPPGPPVNPPWGSTTPGTNQHGDPLWDGPLYGVVYEVTRDDYARIIATEGGGLLYRDVLVPCFVVAPRMGVPEKPLLPVPVRPFLAHTLWSPQLGGGDGTDADADDDNDDDDGGDGDEDDDDWFARHWKALRKRILKFALLRARPDPDYAQPTRRYLGLLTDGAREHELPDAYQQWLASLQPYTITHWRQTVGAWLLLATSLPYLLILAVVDWLPGESTGRLPPWLMVVMGLLMHGMWWTYDHVLRPVLGDGERTEEAGEGEKRGLGRHVSAHAGGGADSETTPLFHESV